MVAQIAPTAVPHRQYSQLIIGGLWPSTDPGTWSDAADNFNRKSDELAQESTSIRQTANGLPAMDEKGDTIDSFVNSAHDSSNVCSQQGEDYGHMATAADEVSRAVYGLREDLDKIDSDANQEIQRLIDEAKSMGNHPGMMAALTAKINEVIATARASATAVSASAAGHITVQSMRFMGTGIGTGPGGETAPSVQPADFGGGGSGAPGRDGVPTRMGTGIDQPPLKTGAGGGSQEDGPLQDVGTRTPGEKGGTPTKAGDVKDAGPTTELGSSSGETGPIADYGPSSGRGGPPTSTVTPPSPSSLLSGGSGGGFSPPSTSGLSGMGSGGSGLGNVSPASLSGASPASGLTSPAGLGSPPAMGGAGAPAAPSDFTRGFNAGSASGGGAPLLPPPAASPPPSGPGSG